MIWFAPSADTKEQKKHKLVSQNKIILNLNILN